MDGNRIQVFTNQLFGSIRTVIGEDGNPYFCLKDICNSLQFTSSDPVGDIKRSIDQKYGILYNEAYPRNSGVRYIPYIYVPTQVQKGVKKDGTPYYGTFDMIYVSEGMVYYIIFRSNKIEAIYFQMWIFNEVIPLVMGVGPNRSLELLQNEYDNLRNTARELYKNNSKLEQENERLNNYNDIMSSEEGSISSYLRR